MTELTEGMIQNDKDGTIYRFFYDTVRNDRASDNSGRPIFDEVLMMEVLTPGQRNSTPKYEIERKWAAESKQALNLETESRLSPKYNEYKEWIDKFKSQDAKSTSMAGTPLKEWARIDRGLAATLAGSNVFTVEQVANVPDSALDILGMGGRELREQAKAFLGVANGSLDVSQFAARLAAIERENERLHAELNSANDMLRQHAQAASNAKPLVPDSTFAAPEQVVQQPAPPPPIVQQPAPAQSGGLGDLV